MKKYNKEDIVRQYEKSGQIMYASTLNGDYKANNREGKKLTNIFKILEKDEKLAKECIEEFYKSENVVIQCEAAAYSLALNYEIEKAESVLQAISENEENGIFGFNAKMTLKVWQEQGFLKIYQ